MATNARHQSGRDYQSWDEAARQQAQEARDDADRKHKDDKINEYLRNHPSASWAEADYKTNK